MAKGEQLAKSLHTVTVLVNVASWLMQDGDGCSEEQAIEDALEMLRLKDKPDPYELANQAYKQLVKRQETAYAD